MVNFGEVRRTQLAKSTLLTSHVSALGNFSDLLRSVQMLKREWCAESNGKLPYLFIHRKSSILVHAFASGKSAFEHTRNMRMSLCSMPRDTVVKLIPDSYDIKVNVYICHITKL